MSSSVAESGGTASPKSEALRFTGLQIVPTEPTREMLDAAQIHAAGHDRAHRGYDFEDAYRSMLFAAPSPLPWRLMTPKEYAALALRGPHVVEKNYDGFGGIAVWLIGPAENGAISPSEASAGTPATDEQP